MKLDKEILSDLTVHMKYAKYVPELSRRETWVELIDRNNQFRHNLDGQNKDFKTVDKDFKKLDEENWETEFERIYRNCLEYGFSEIKKSEILKRK